MESEIFFHSENFNKILILAQELSQGSLPVRTIPDNAEAFNIATKNKKIARFYDILRGGLRILHPSEASKTDLELIKKSFQKRIFCEYFEQRAQRQYKENLRILKKFDFSHYDEIVIYSYWFFANCRSGVLLKKYFENQGLKVKLVSRAHGYDLYEYANSLNYLPLRGAMAQEVDKIYTCSSNGCRYLRNRIPEYKDKIEASYLGTFDRGITNYSETFHVVTCSRTVRIKKLDRLIEAIACLKNQTEKKVVWTHIGDGPLQKKIKKLSSKKLDFIDVEFLGYMNNAQVMEYYSTHPVSLFINVSKSEGLPVSIMEANSFGIPILATDVGGTGEIVVDGVNGFLLNSKFTNEEFIVKFFSILNADDEVYQRMRKNAREIWEKNFDAEKNYPEFCKKISETEEVMA
ncbi:MAG: glycosyltransferase [Clostridia bacterium]|nr:glycosyltransferase [Clostridia bacterium]